MIGKVLLGAVLLLGGGVALSSMGRPIGGSPTPPKPPTPPSPTPSPTPTPPTTYAPGQTVSTAIDVDSLLASSPVISGPPLVGQIVQVAAKDPFALDQGESIPVQVTVQAVTASGRITGYVSKDTLDWLTEEVPALESKLPPTAYTHGVYVSFSGDRVWGYGAYESPAPPAPATAPTGTKIGLSAASRLPLPPMSFMGYMYDPAAMVCNEGTGCVCARSVWKDLKGDLFAFIYSSSAPPYAAAVDPSTPLYSTEPRCPGT